MRNLMAWVLLVVFVLMASGCTKTIEGIQEDSSSAWHGTKKLIHDVTAD